MAALTGVCTTQLCGGHGYHRFSGLATLFLDYVPHVTYEGENTVMYLQTGRCVLLQHCVGEC